MSEIKRVLGKKTWIGALTALLASVVLDGGGALLMSNGVIPEMPAWVYGAYAISAFIGVRIAVGGERRAMPRALAVCMIMWGTVCLIGWLSYGAISVGDHGIGAAAGIIGGSLCGGCLGGNRREGKKKRRKRAAAKR